MRARYERDKDPADLDGAARHIQAAVLQAGPGDPEYGMYASNQGGWRR